MSVLSFFFRLKYGSYKHSHKPAFYEEIAKQFHVSPQHVYEIQHGKTVRSRLDGAISDELLARAFEKRVGDRRPHPPAPLSTVARGESKTSEGGEQNPENLKS